MSEEQEERLPSISERKIMPPDLLSHYIEARRAAYAGGGEYILDAILHGFKVFKFSNPTSPFYFEDRFADNSKRPGNFAGFEINRRYPNGPRFSLYTYSGGLTKEGESFGEKVIYPRLV